MDMEEVFRKIVETLRRDHDPDKIIVFGSHARGEAMGDCSYHQLLREGRVLHDRSARNEDTTQEVRHVLAPCRHCHG